MIRIILIGFMAAVMCAFTMVEIYAAPGQPSIVWIEGTQMRIQKRLPDGSLGGEKTFIIKGVDYSSATAAPAQGPNPPPKNNTTDYGFFFDWEGRVPQGHEVLNFWLRNEFGKYTSGNYTSSNYAVKDTPLLQEMHTNTVRVYTDFGKDTAFYAPILNAFYDKGIMVIMTVAVSEENLVNKQYIEIVSQYKNHPAILMWSLGNEWNSNNYYSGSSLTTLMNLTNEAAGWIKSNDKNHPVSSCLGDRFADDEIYNIVNSCPNVDVWGLNLYRGASFGNLFEQWKKIGFKPFYISEFGTDSFKTTGYTIVVNTTKADNCKGIVDQNLQSNHVMGLWKEIEAHLSAFYSNNSCLGGLVFEFNDELWKVGSFHAGLGDLVDYKTAPDQHSYDHYNTEGFYLPGCHPDNVANEEYFGIVDSIRQKKVVFNKLRDYYCALETRLYPIGNKTVYVGYLFSFVVTAEDLNKDIIVLSADGIPKGASFTTISSSGKVSQTFSWKPTSKGKYYVTFKATKGSCNPKTEKILINVISQPKPPPPSVE